MSKKMYVSMAICAASLWCCTQAQPPRVAFETPAGDIVAEIYLEKAPVTAANFLKLVDGGVYNTPQTAFYRVVRMDNQSNAVKIEVIQGGLSDRDVVAPIPHETTAQTGVLHLDGTLSMARKEPGTASSEFFICIGDQPELNFGGTRNADGQGFAAFGRVIEGMDVVKQIQQQTDTSQYLVSPVPITAVRRLQ
ncbi:MAG: peptidylprolyl isomerase [Prevotellaceae bacterium]|jgi:peptidyl-prolyl cis-trans isomerase A (cyclophilin A)|nr:peptidylprolyl isomerase [Prevotellaceae bacterium]